MAHDMFNQFKEQLAKSSTILIILPKSGTIDTCCAAIVLANYLRTHSKKVDVVRDAFSIPPHLSYLNKNLQEIFDTLPPYQQVTIAINVATTPLSELSYEVKNDTLAIHISTKSGTIDTQSIVTSLNAYRYDCIISIGALNKHSLGNPAIHAASLFHDIPLINIDYQSENEHFGHINIVDITASSSCELIVRLCEQLATTTFSKNDATLLLTGIIVSTKNFTTQNVSPKILQIASRLMDMEAAREEIVNNLFRTRSLSSLSLWGTVLSSLHVEPSHKLVWNIIPHQNYSHIHISEHDWDDIIDEILANTKDTDCVILFYEQKQGEQYVSYAHIATNNSRDARTLCEPFKGEKNKHYAKLMFQNLSLSETSDTVLAHIRSIG